MQSMCLTKFKLGISNNSTKISLGDALLNPKYRTATWVNNFMIMFNTLTGINVILLYSTQMLTEMKSPNGSGLSPREGTYLIGVVDFIVPFFALITIKYLGRRP